MLDFYANFERGDTTLTITRIARRHLVFCLSMYGHNGMGIKKQLALLILSFETTWFIMCYHILPLRTWKPSHGPEFNPNSST